LYLLKFFRCWWPPLPTVFVVSVPPPFRNGFLTCAIFFKYNCINSTSKFPFNGAHPCLSFSLSLCPPCPICSPFATCAILSYLSSIFTCVSPPNPHYNFLNSVPTLACYFPCLGAHPCAETCSLGCSRRTTRTPWTTGWSTSIFSCVSAHPHYTIFYIQCPPVPTIFPVSVPTPGPTHVLCSAAAVLPLHPGLQAGARLHDPALPHPLIPRQGQQE